MTNRQIEQNFCLIIQLNWACLQDYTQGATYRIIGNIKASASLQSQPQESDNSQKLCPVIPCTTFSQLHQKMSPLSSYLQQVHPGQGALWITHFLDFLSLVHFMNF